jgi:hypothetical protein
VGVKVPVAVENVPSCAVTVGAVPNVWLLRATLHPRLCPRRVRLDDLGLAPVDLAGQVQGDHVGQGLHVDPAHPELAEVHRQGRRADQHRHEHRHHRQDRAALATVPLPGAQHAPHPCPPHRHGLVQSTCATAV